jgi:methylamine utilization protein MauE
VDNFAPDWRLSMATRLLLRFLGLALISAGALKAQGLFVPQLVGPEASGFGSWFQVALIYGEILVGVWLIFGQSVQLNWLLACGLFSVFAVINAVKALEGETSCGCFGAIKANPWLVFSADLVVVLLLLWIRPKFVVSANLLGAISGFLTNLGAGMGAFAAVLLVLILVFGSEERAIAQLRGDTCSINPEVVDFGDGEPGEFKTQRIFFRNWSRESIQIVGGSSGCSFRATTDLPITVPEQGIISLRVSIRFPKLPGRFAEGRYLVCGTKSLDMVHFLVRGRAVVK